MENKIGIEQWRDMGKRMSSVLGLSSLPVGVRLLLDNQKYPEEAQRLSQHRYCQALMKARRGEHVLLDGEGIACPAAANAFGFRPLPEGLKTGKGLVGFGIVADETVGKKMFEGMPSFQAGRISKLYLFPLSTTLQEPEIIIVEDEVEKLMWIALSSLHAKGGARIQGSTAVLQATCVDSTIIPYLENRLNIGYGCYGCRDATDIGPNETVLGFPATMFEVIVRHLEFLGSKAIPTSRSKRAFAGLEKRIPENSDDCDSKMR
jgi:uncharacterized protein (DUF169 family)